MNRVVIAICALCLLVPPLALAKSPPKKTYDCVIGSTLFGVLKVTSTSRYTHRGKAGAYKAGAKRVKFSDGRSGYTLRFTSGPLKGMEGRWYKGSDHGRTVYEIALQNPVDGFENIYCDSRR